MLGRALCSAHEPDAPAADSQGATTISSPALDSLTLRVTAEHIAAAVVPVPGRPVLERDPDTVQKLLAALADGNYRQTACRIAGIAPQTLYNAIKRSEAGEPAAIALVEAVEKAEAAAEGQIVQQWRKAIDAGPQYWAAAATFLERKSPDRWGKRQDDASVPRVVVQIGARDSDISVSVSAPRTDDAVDAVVNTISYYPNQTDSEGQQTQALTATPQAAFAGESQGRKSLSAQRKSAGPSPTQARRGNPRGTQTGGRTAGSVRRADRRKGRVPGAGAEKGEA